jgi:outer membrane biosynthesis protein TonB
MVVVAIAVVLVVVGLVLFHPWSSSNVQPKLQPHDTPTSETTPATTEPPTNSIPQPPPVAEPVPDSHAKPQPPVVKPPVKPVDKAAKDKDKTKKPEDTPIVGFEGNSTYDGMTQRDIPRLLQWARSDAGNGNYAKAAQEYRVILQLQPNNPDAREGLRKIQLAQGRDQ